MSYSADTVIIGAGPYGLSLAAHLLAANVDFVIIGHPMDAWANHMPEGMLLKSDGFASNLYDPAGAFTLRAGSAWTGASPITTRSRRFSLATFVDYGMAFARRHAPDLKDALVVSLAREGDRFRLTTDDGASVIARRVVVAAEIGPFRYMPPQLSGLGEAQVSHSYDHHALDGFRGRSVAVIGGGAVGDRHRGTASRHGCDVHLICRADSLKFGGMPTERTLSQRIRRPGSGLGPGWRSRLATDAPLVFHKLPASMRLPIVERHLGPAASAYMKDKVVGRVPVLAGQELLAATAEGDRVRLSLRGPDGNTTSPAFDHVIAATGYRVDIGSLPFIDEALRTDIACVGRTPVLSTRFEFLGQGPVFHRDRRGEQLRAPASNSPSAPASRPEGSRERSSRRRRQGCRRRMRRRASPGEACRPDCAQPPLVERVAAGDRLQECGLLGRGDRDPRPSGPCDAVARPDVRLCAARSARVPAQGHRTVAAGADPPVR